MEASRSLVSRFRGCVSFCKKLAQSFVKPTPELGLNPMVSPSPSPPPPPKPSGHVQVQVDTSKWRKVNSRSLGITFTMIPESSRIVLTILRNEGYDAYLVGGCVRDLILRKVPKDFDVITTANLEEIKKKFHRSYIVGRKFPICLVHVRGSAIEVSSFATVASHATEKEDIHLTEMPEGCDAKEFLRWRNSLQRDFTINSLFFDPFAQRIYDYSNGMTDLKAKKLRTLVPAHSSFEEDCARILRGIRIAARLRLSFAEDTEKAIHNLHTSITTLDKGRLMMELNYMLSYGAAEPSLILLKRFKILELLLPFQAAYLAERSRPSSTQSPVMLMKLFFNLDSLTSCDQPCSSGLWVSLLAFHLTLVNNPQVAIVVWAFSYLLYHGNWKESVKAARKYSAGHVLFTPEIKPWDSVTDEELSQKVANFALLVLDSIDMLTNSESLCIAMSRCYPSSPTSGLAYISYNSGKDVSAIFSVLMNDIESLREERRYHNIDYNLLGKGDISETRFALGKIIMDTMRSGVICNRTGLATEKKDDLRACKPKVENQTSSISKLETVIGKDRAKQGRSVLDDLKRQQKAKQQKLMKLSIDLQQKGVKEKMEETLSYPDIAQKKQQLIEEEDLRACKPKVKKTQVKNPTSSTSKLETVAVEDEAKQGRSVLEDQKHQLKPKHRKVKKQSINLEQKGIKEKMEQTLSCPDVAQKKQQLKKVVVKDAKKLLSFQEVGLKNVKVESEKLCEAQTSNRIHSLLGKVLKMGTHHETQAPEEILGMVGKVIAIRKQRMSQAPEEILSILGKVSQLKIPRKEQLPTDMVDALSDMYQTKEDDREEKQARLVDRPQDEPLTTKKSRKLSSIFK